MPKTAHLYKDGSTFKKVMMLYRFDKKLRLLMFNEIEKIEIAIRRAVMQITADMTGNPFWLTDSSYFLDSFKFNETMRAISKEYCKSKEEFILHFKRESGKTKCARFEKRNVQKSGKTKRSKKFAHTTL